jgi:molecular chaperone GrpE (heat shock protein)
VNNTLRVTVDSVPAGTAAKDTVVVVSKSRDEEIASLKEQLAKSKDELAKVSAELERIKKRLANPNG